LSDDPKADLLNLARDAGFEVDFEVAEIPTGWSCVVTALGVSRGGTSQRRTGAEVEAAAGMLSLLEAAQRRRYEVRNCFGLRGIAKRIAGGRPIAGVDGPGWARKIADCGAGAPPLSRRRLAFLKQQAGAAIPVVDVVDYSDSNNPLFCSVQFYRRPEGVYVMNGCAHVSAREGLWREAEYVIAMKECGTTG